MNQLISLEISRIKKVFAFKLNFDGRNITKVIGPNASGKSTVIDALEVLFGWKKEKDMITHGEFFGSILAVYADENGEHFTVKRKFTPSGNYLAIQPENSDKIKSPQEYLTKMFGEMSFSPMKFFQAERSEQEDIILEVAGLSYRLREWQLTYDRVYQNRHDAKILMNKAKDTLLKIPYVEETEFKDSEKILNQYNKASQRNQENDILRKKYEHDKQKLDDFNREEKQITSNIKDIDKDIHDVEEEIKRLVAKKASLAEKKNLWEEKLIEVTKSKISHELKLENDLKSIKDLVDIDLTKFQDELSALSEHNKNAALWQSKQEAVTEFKSKREIWANYDAELKSLIEEKRKLLQESEYPIEGLIYTDEGLKYKDSLLENCSTSERLLIACHIMRSRQPNLNVMLIDNAECLDSDNKEILFEFARENKLHVLLAEVKDTDFEEDAVVIVDGAVVQNPYV